MLIEVCLIELFVASKYHLLTYIIVCHFFNLQCDFIKLSILNFPIFNPYSRISSSNIRVQTK